MDNKGQIDAKSKQMQGLLNRCLRVGSMSKGFEVDSNHLDEDSIAAFVEGNLSVREAKPVVSHLACCSYCRHISAEIVKLDVSLEEIPAMHLEEEAKPSRVSDVLNGILGRIFGANDGAVFAHHEKPEDQDEEDEKDTSS